jgi:hypothetical protein
MIKKIKTVLKRTYKFFIPKSEKIIQKVTEKLNKTHKTIPAPVITPTDAWFDKPVLSQKALDKQAEIYHNERVERENNTSKEPQNIHQVMYEKATKGINTTLTLDPLPQGGSENFQGGWNSGTGMNQFRD